MNRHLSFRSGNPTLTKNTFKNISDSATSRMTLEGTVNKTMIALILLLCSAVYTFSNQNTSLIWLGFIVGFILVLISYCMYLLNTGQSIRK